MSVREKFMSLEDILLEVSEGASKRSSRMGASAAWGSAGGCQRKHSGVHTLTSHILYWIFIYLQGRELCITAVVWTEGTFGAFV